MPFNLSADKRFESHGLAGRKIQGSATEQTKKPVPFFNSLRLNNLTAVPDKHCYGTTTEATLWIIQYIVVVV